MNEPPGVTSVLGIEAVEWIAEGGENLTVQVTGRWRRRRPAWSAQPTLVIEGQGRRYRFPAIAEPPSVTGTGPGMWRFSFAVPAALAAELGGRAWLQFGAVLVPLPAAAGMAPTSETSQAPAPETPSGDPPTSTRPAGPAEAVSSTGGTAQASGPELTARVRALETAVHDARSEAQRLVAELAEVQFARRAAEQGARAERTLRTELASQLAASRQQTAQAREQLGELDSALARVRELEQELDTARQGIPATVESAAAAEPAALQESEADGRRRGLEHELIARQADRARRIPAEPAIPPAPEPQGPPAVPVLTHSAAQSLVSGTLDRDTLLAALREELDARSRTEAALRARLVEAEARLSARDLIERRTSTILAHLRRELERLRADLAREQAAREAVEERARGLEAELGGARERTLAASEAITELRETLEALRRPAPGAPPAPAGPPPSRIEADRLNQALSRLREQIAPQAETDAEAAGGAPDAVPDPPQAPAQAAADALPLPAEQAPLTVGRPWLRPAFRALARVDPDRAGRLIIDLLAAQRAVHAAPVAYDLTMGGDLGCIRVTVRGSSVQIDVDEAPRSPDDVDFAVTGTPASLGRLLAAGRLRRRFSRRVARVRGTRAGLAALDALVTTQLSLGALNRAGVRLAPRTALSLLAQLVRPEWVTDERFAMAYRVSDRPPAYLVVTDGRGVRVTETPPTGRLTTIITGPAGTLERLLAGDLSLTDAVSGEDWPLEALRGWIHRAQSE